MLQFNLCFISILQEHPNRPMKSSSITIKDIARILGISPSTVSRALKDHPDISVETKRAVNDLAAQLKYQPNAIRNNFV